MRDRDGICRSLQAKGGRIATTGVRTGLAIQTRKRIVMNENRSAGY